MDKYPTPSEIRSWSSVKLLDVFTGVRCLLCGDDPDLAAILYIADLTDEILRRMGR